MNYPTIVFQELHGPFRACKTPTALQRHHVPTPPLHLVSQSRSSNKQGPTETLSRGGRLKQVPPFKSSPLHIPMPQIILKSNKHALAPEL
jgi:hypothetical protein